jgi:uncharacterized protein Veg
MESVKEQILAIVGEYRELPADYIDVNDLMYKRKLLATYGANFSVETGQARADWKRATFRYDITRNQKQIVFYQKQSNLGKADMYAKANTEELYEKSVEAENKYFELDYIFKALRETLGELNQRIAYLRDELKQERFFNSET